MPFFSPQFFSSSVATGISFREERAWVGKKRGGYRNKNKNPFFFAVLPRVTCISFCVAAEGGPPSSSSAFLPPLFNCEMGRVETFRSRITPPSDPPYSSGRAKGGEVTFVVPFLLPPPFFLLLLAPCRKERGFNVRRRIRGRKRAVGWMVDEEGGGQNSKALLLRLNHLFIATGHPTL